MIVILGGKKKVRILWRKASVRDWIRLTKAVIEHVGNNTSNENMHIYLTRMEPIFNECVKINERLLNDERK